MSFSRLSSLVLLGASLGTSLSQAQDPVSAAPPPPAVSSVAATDASVPAPEPSQPASPGEARAKADAANQALPYDYKIGAGDTLHISVWKEPEVSATVAVRPDGKISLALLKEIYVLGLTPVELEQLITQRLTKQITEPDVTVVVSGINSLKIYVIGQVKNTSTIPYTYQMTIFQAISEAGGLTDYAKRKEIYVKRLVNGKEKHLPFNYERALKQEGTEINFYLLPGDTLVVP